MDLNTDFGGKKVLNIGCGSSILTDPNAVNVDFYGSHKDKVVKWNLNIVPYTFVQPESFDLIIANHVLEHLENWWAVFEECARLLKVGGQLQIWVPGAGDSVRGYRDHVTEINQCSFFGTWDNFTYNRNSWCEDFGISPANQLKCVSHDKVLYPKWWLRWAPSGLKNFFITHLRNVVFEQGFTFTKYPKIAVETKLNHAKLTGDRPHGR